MKYRRPLNERLNLGQFTAAIDQMPLVIQSDVAYFDRKFLYEVLTISQGLSFIST